jgi:mono/diheme cytochrome c family protein
MPPGIYHLFPDIVLRGLLSKEGMESFADELTARDVSAIRAYITAEAWSAYRAQKVSHTPAAH